MADLARLFAANHGRLFRYLCRAVGHAETARDLTQEVFLRVSRTAHMKPNEIVDVALTPGDTPDPFPNRVFSVSIQTTQLR